MRYDTKPAGLVRSGMRQLHLVYPILTGIQVDDAKNRAYAHRAGADRIPWPVPHSHSTLALCAFCDGQVWVGPAIQKERERRMSAGTTGEVLCLLCCAIIFGTDVDL